MRALGRDPRTGLLTLAIGLLALFVLFWIWRPISEDELRDSIEPLGALAPVAYVLAAAVLGAALVPGPLLAGASGLLFGTVWGTLVTIASATLSALLALWIGWRVGSAGVREVSGSRARQIEERLRGHGLLTVVVQRLAPGIPDAPTSYAAGTIRIRPRDIALGTVVGALPRAFSYTALGDGLANPDSPLALIGIAGVVLTGIAGLALLALIGHRHGRRASPDPE